MAKPILVVMAAGMGSRYGGLKQVDPVGPNTEALLEYSIFDAKRAGFETVVFVINENIEEEFKAKVGNRVAKRMQVRYAYQKLDKIPEGFEIPEGREKPWGTAHAILSAKDQIDSSFAVINADDYYGPKAFRKIFNFLSDTQSFSRGRLNMAMVGFQLKNTVSEHGSVSRGICTVDDDGYLQGIDEKTDIVSRRDGIYFTEDDGESYEELDPNTIVSMNIWGFPEEILKYMEIGFRDFLNKDIQKNPLKAEFYLPTVVETLLDQNKARVRVLRSNDKWYGVTYKEDKEGVVNAIRRKIRKRSYPEDLYE